MPRRNEGDEAEFGDALQHRLSQLAARLERLATAPSPAAPAPKSASPAPKTPEASAPVENLHSYEAPPRWDDSDGDDENEASGKGEPAPAAKAAPDRDAGDNSGIANIAAALRDLGKPAAAAKPEHDQPLPVDQSPEQNPETRLAAIRQRIDALRSRREESAPKQAKAAMAAPKPVKAAGAPATAAPAAARAETPLPPTAKPPAAAKPAAAGEVAGDDLAKALAELVEQTEKSAEPLSQKAEAELLAARPAAAPGAGDIADLGRQLDELRRLIRSNAADTSMSAIEASQSVIMERLDQMMRGRPEENLDQIAQRILERVPSSERIDSISAELDRLSERVASLDNRDLLDRIEARLFAFEERLSATQQRADENQPAQQIETSLAAVRDSVDGLTRMLHEDGTPALARLEERLNQVSARFEATLENAPRAESVANLFERLEALAARGEAAPPAIEALAREIAEIREREHTELASLDTHIQQLAERLDSAIGGKAFEAKSLDDIESRIAALSQRLDELGNADPGSDRAGELLQVEDQIAELSGRIDQLDSSDASSDGLSALERQVGELMSRLEQLSADHDSLQLVQEHLSKLETMVAQSGGQSPDAVREAAREAVRELSNIESAHHGSATLDGLKSDLRALQDAAQTSDHETGQSLDQVNQTLDRVVARLSGLEEEMRGRARGAAKSAPNPAPATTPAAEAPASEAEDWAPIPPDQPLVPDAPRPRIAATGEDRERRADFIAAARRAAQAAAAEHAMQQRTEEAAEDRPKGRLRRMISDHRRPLIIAAGAIVLTIAVLTILQPFGGGDGAGEPEAPAPVVEPADDAAVPTPAALALEPRVAADPGGDFAPPEADIAPTNAISPDALAVGPMPVAEEATTYPMPEEAVGSLRLRTAAASGDPAALYEVAARYADGRFVATDLAEAAIWFERAAETGLAVAQFRLAELLENGLGVPIDRQAAADWYLSAAEQGNVLAMHNLAVLLSQGIDGTPDFAGAIEWFTAGAEHGIRDSQYNLGVIYARGIGTEPDLIASYQWFAIAASQGDSDAAARRDEVAVTLTPDQLAAARAAVSAWSVAGAPAAANTVAVPDDGWDPPEERVELEDREELVRTIQALLIERGYDPGPADGVEGPMTVEAIMAFQATLGIEPTGEISEELLAALAD